MWKWGSGDNSAVQPIVQETSQAANMSVADLTEQLARTEQLVAQLKEHVKEKDNELRSKEQSLKEEKEAFEARLSKLKLQNKAKVTSLNSQLEELKKQLSGAGTQEGKHEHKRVSRDGDQENAAASRGKILVLRKKVEELETQNAQRNEELQKKIVELDAAHQRGAEMDAMLADKQKKLAEKESYIIDLQLACGSTTDAKEILAHNSKLKNQLSAKETSLQSMQILVQNLTKKVEESEEKCSLLQEQIETLKNLQVKEKEHFQEREAMYTQNIRMFQNIIQEKEKELMGQAQKHEQELFKLAAKSDASADLEQLLKALKQKLHEKEEVMLGRTQVIVMLQQELDGKDQQLKEVNEHLKHLQSEKDNLQSKLDAEKHVMRAQLRDMMEKHENEMKRIKEKHNADIQTIQEKHETELQEKDITLNQLQEQVTKLSTCGQSNLEQMDIDAVIKQKLEQLEAQAKLKTEEASKSEAKFLKMKAWSKSRIKQLEDELKNVISKNNDVIALQNKISELEQDKEDLQSTLQMFSELKTQNEELLAKLEVYEEQQRKLQADLEQVTKRAASQASESGSVDELQSQLLEWQEIVTESEDMHNQIREEKSAMALRMAQIEEEREAIVSGQQELEEELTTGQGIGRMQPERRKSAQSSRIHQEDYGFDRKPCYEELNITLDSTDSAEGENMGGLRTVVEELELERNQLQEQILLLEERCRDMEDRLQLQGRMEALQNENDRLQSQLTQLRNQQARDSEKHQVFVSSMNEQLKGLNERNGLLETLLAEKEQKLSSTKERLEQIEELRKSLQERDLLNKELSEKLLQTEQKLEDTLKKCHAYEAECAEQKAVICDLTDKVAVFKDKTLKQESAIELIRLDLEQTNEELDRLNTSHLEERSQLIQDLQRREREIDSLREVLVEKDKEISALSSSMTEYSEQINILKHQNKCKEDEMREIEEALSKVQREAQLLKDVQTTDVKDASTKISVLSEQLSTIESELANTKMNNEAKIKENEELVRQIKETSKTIKDLNSEIKSREVTYNSKLTECESQIKLLKEQISKSAEKLQEAEKKCREETELLKSQIDEHISAKEKLNTLLKERENKEQFFVNELKSVKDLYNQLILENAKKDEELANLSRQLAEYTENLDVAKKSLQEKTEIINSLQDKIKCVEKESENEKLSFVRELNSKEMQWKELNNKLLEKLEIINKMETEKQTDSLTNKEVQTALEQKEKDFAVQLKAQEVLRNEVHTMEKEKQQLISENESLSKLLDVKECELLKRTQSITEMEYKMSASAVEYEKKLSEVSRDKETLKNKVEELSSLVKQKESSIMAQLLEKEKEYDLLADQLSKSKQMTKQLHEEIQSFSTQLKNTKDREVEKEEMLSQKESVYNKVVQQLSQEEEKLLALQKQVQDMETELKLKSNSLEESTKHSNDLLKQIEEKQSKTTLLEKEVERLQGGSTQLSQKVEEKDSVLLSQQQELEELHKQISKKTEEHVALKDQLTRISKEMDVLKFEKDNALAICSAKSNECDVLQHQLTQHQSEIVSVKHEVHMLNMENKKLKVDIETVNAALMKKCEEMASLNTQLSLQGHNILTLTDQVDTLVTETKTLKSSVQDKEVLLSQKEALLKQMNENKEGDVKQYLQMISDLQSEVQAIENEAGKLREDVQGKENQLKKQAQELKLFKDKSEESELFRVQLSENMEIISDLQFQLKNMTNKTEELNKSITEKDGFLRQKEEECINLQTHISEASCMQQKQVELLTSETEQLRAIVSEKESLNSQLKTELQDKESECEHLKKQATGIEEMNLNLKKEIGDQKKLITDISQELTEGISLLDNTSLVKELRKKLKLNDDNIQLVSQLHGQINELTQEIKKLQELAQEKESAFLSLQDKFATQYEQRNELSVTLSKKEEFIAGLLTSLGQKDESVQLAESNVHALTNEIELLREELEKSAATSKKLLQEKDENITIDQKRTDSLTVELEYAKLEHQKALENVDIWKQKVQERDESLQVVQEKCTEQAKCIEILNSELSIVNSRLSQESLNHTLSIEKLQQQVDSFYKENIRLQENFDKLSIENKELAKYQNLSEQKSKELQEVHDKLEANENESRMQLDAIILKLENEKEQLQMQVSVKGEETGELKLKVESLEQSLLESEHRRVTDLDRETQKNALNLGQLSNLEREMKSKDAQIQYLQQEQDFVKKELSEHFSALSNNMYFIKDSDGGQEVTDSKTVLKQFSALIASKETETRGLQQTLLDREKELHHLNNQLESMQSLREEKEVMQNDFEKAKDTYRSEIEYLSGELSAVKEALNKQKSICEEREIAVTNMKEQVTSLQEKIDNSDKELENSCKKLNAECQKVATLLAEAEHKNQMIENLTSQTSQQKDLISSLSQQLKEKDCSVAQVMESMSNEMIKFSEEKNLLASKMQQLEAARNSTMEEANILSKQLEECKKELELNQIALTEREATMRDLMSEKEQYNSNIEKLSHEKETLKKKLQAALLIRKDLMQKIGKLEKCGQEDLEQERKKTEDLLEQIEEFSKQVKCAEIQNKDLQSQIESLKEQLLEKDAKITGMSETLSTNTMYLEQQQKNITELKDTVAEQKTITDKNLRSIEEKDSLLAQMQFMLSDKEQAYQVEHSQLLLTIENLKTEIAKKEETLRGMNGEDATLNTEDGCSDSDTAHLPSESIQLNKLQREKKTLHRKLQALLVARKESTKKIQKEMEEHAKLLEKFDEQTKDFELLKKEHTALQEIHQRKCKEFDSNLLLLYSLQKNVDIHETNENAKQKTVGSEEVKMKGCVMAEELEVMVNAEKAMMEKLHSDCAGLMEEKEKLKEELRVMSLELDRKVQESVKLKIYVESLEHQHKQDKDKMLIEIGRLQQQLEVYEKELTDMKIVMESVCNERDILKKGEEDHVISLHEVENLKHEIQQANTQIAEKNEEIRYLHHSVKELQGKFEQGKEILKEVSQLQESLQESQKETKHFKTVFEQMKQEREEFVSNLEKSNTELQNMKDELRGASEENQKLLMELNLLHQNVLPASKAGKNMAVYAKGGEKKTDTETVVLHSDNVLHDRVQNEDISSELLDATHTGRIAGMETAVSQDQPLAEITQEHMEKSINGSDCKLQEQMYATKERNRDGLQRKLQAALISRKEALKENKILKDQMDLLMLENKELIDKTQSLGLFVSELSREKTDLNAVLRKDKEALASENASLLIENENLTAACESLKSTMETIVQEKEAFSFQLNSLKDSQTVELTGWKAKHGELKQDYESLLQAYENISSKIAEMRQIIDATRKEKQEALRRANERETEKQELEKLLQKAMDENMHASTQLKQLVQCKEKEIGELQIEAERQASEHKLCLEEYKKRVDECALENRQLSEENEQLKEISITTKQTLDKTQKEKERFAKDFSQIQSAVRDLQTKLKLDKLDVQSESKISNTLNEGESLIQQILVINEEVSEKEKSMLILKQENKLMSERLKDAEESLCLEKCSLSKLENECKSLNREIVSLSERIKILEDDKCLLQEELENFQETSYKLKNEREFLETELLNHVKKLDQTTDKLKATQTQSSLLMQQLEDLKAEKCDVIREKEEQHLHLVRVFEEKVKSGQRDNNGTKNKTKELQELLKEKQQQINQLQKDSIKYQELILDLEKSVKLSQSKSEKFEKDLNNTAEKLSKSNEDMQKLMEKLSHQNMLLDESKAEIERLVTENLNHEKELGKKENQILNQKKEYDKQLELALQRLKASCQKEWLNLEEKYSTLQREKERLLGEHHQLQEEMVVRDTQNKNLQVELNEALARLAAFAKCMSSLQNDRDRVIAEMKTWETQFKEAIESKQHQIDAKNNTIISLQNEMKAKINHIQELEDKNYVLEESKNAEVPVDVDHFNELSRIKAENVALQNRQRELANALQSKEGSLQALMKEKNYLNHLIKNNTIIEKEMEALKINLTKSDHEMQQILLEKNEIQAELEKQTAISEQMKVMLNQKDAEISLLISSKDTEISGYLAQIQLQHRQQIAEYCQQLKTLQIAKEHADETCKGMQNELKNLQTKADQAVRDRAELASEISAFKKSMSSLQNDRDSLLSKQKDIEHEHRALLCEKESLLGDSANENRKLKQELRKLLNEIDDLHAENALLTAQLIKYREDLNQVLCLKDHQLKELLTQKLENIKNLEQEKLDLQKKLNEMQLTVKVQEEIVESLRLENKKLTSKAHDLEVLIASLNKERLEAREKLPCQESDGFDQKKGLAIQQQLEEKSGEKLPKFQQDTKDAEDKHQNTVSTLLKNETAEKTLLEVQFQNKELRTQIESFGKAMTALQGERERLIENFKALQSKYTFELESEKRRTEKLEMELGDFKSSVLSVFKKSSLLNETLLEAESKITIDQLSDELENLCSLLNTRDLEISRLSSERENYVQQIDAFSKAMASLQDDRDRLLQELSRHRVVNEAKQGTGTISIPSGYVNEISALKHNLEALQMDRERLVKEGANVATAEISKLKAKVDDLERALQQTKVFQEEFEKEKTSYQNELAQLRMEKNLLLAESQASQNQFQATLSEKGRQIAELQRVHHEMLSQTPKTSSFPTQGLETVALVGSTDIPEQVNRLLAERSRLQNELQRCLQEMHQRELQFQQMNSKVMQSIEENGLLSAQLKTVSQTLQDNQLRYTDLQNRYLRLEREYQVQVASGQGTAQGETQGEVPPGAPQERAAVVEIDNMELSELRKRLAEMELQHDSVQQTVSQLMETLSQERSRRQAAEEALGLSEEQAKRLTTPRDYTVQMESDEEREALIINTSEHIIVRKMKGGALSLRRWIRGRSLYCSKLLTSRAKSRYLFLSYLVILHLLVLFCLTGIL